jgi:hypothetical protein
MTKAEIDELAEGWIRYQLSGDDSTEHADWKYVSAAFDIRMGDPNVLWQLILSIHSRTQSEDVRCVLSAGPLEDLLVNHGTAFIEIVERQADHDPTFASLLKGVYTYRMDDDLRRRVEDIGRR